MHGDHKEEIVDLAGSGLLDGVTSERVFRVKVRSIFQVLFDDSQAGYAGSVELKLSPTADKIVCGAEELGQYW